MDNPNGSQERPPVRQARRRKNRRSSRPEMLSRDVVVSSFRATLRLHAVHHKGDEPSIETKPWLELQGTATEPIKDVQDVTISMYPEDDLRVGTSRPASVGAIINVRPVINVVLAWPPGEYDRLWALALSGQLKYVGFYPTGRRVSTMSTAVALRWRTPAPKTALCRDGRTTAPQMPTSIAS